MNIFGGRFGAGKPKGVPGGGSVVAPEKARSGGTPVRPEVPGAPILPGGGGATRGLYLVVVGGRQGARSGHRAEVAALPRLLATHPTLRVIHQTGERDYEEVVAAYRNAGPPPAQMEVVPFLFDVPRAVRQADLIVSRSGATTGAEITACGKPSLLI